MELLKILITAEARHIIVPKPMNKFSIYTYLYNFINHICN